MNEKKWLRRGLWIGGGAAVVVLLVLFVIRPRLQDRAEAAQNDGETVTAFIGDLSATASASGQVMARREATVALDVAGVVTSVNVRVGDVVADGDTLLTIDATSYELNVAAAEQNLAIQQANLDALVTSATPAEIAAAEAAVASAQANLDVLLNGPRPAEIAAAEANLRAAEANVRAAVAQQAQAAAGPTAAQIAAAEAEVAQARIQQTNARLANEDDPNASTDAALQDANEVVAVAQARLDELLEGADSNAVSAAAANAEAARAQAESAAIQVEELQQPATASEIAAAEAQMAQAQSNLADLREPASEQRIEAAEAQVAQAEINLADAQAALEDTVLVAPFDGVVTAVNVDVGEVASGPVVQLMNSSTLEVILAVDELDVGQLAVGQPAVITLEPWPETEIETEIAAIAPSGNSSGALVTYDVRLPLDEIPLPARAGMTANANLVTANREDILLVANRAIRIDRQTGETTVVVVTRNADGEPDYQEVEIRLGLRDNQYSQIVDGLSAGDEVLIGELPTVDLEGGPFGG